MNDTGKQRILLLGGRGFLGTHLLQHLQKDYNILVFDQAGFSDPISGVEIIEGDFQTHQWSDEVLNSIDIVIDLIWTTLPASSNKDCAHDVSSNILPLIRLLDQLKQHSHIHFIFISSGGTVYGDQAELYLDETLQEHPQCSYGITKLMAEKYLALYHHLHGLNYHILRLSNPYGPHQSWTKKQGFIMTALHHAISQTPIEIWGDGSVLRDYIFIDDVTRAISTVLHYTGQERLFNISSHTGHSLLDIVHIIENISHQKLMLNFKDKRPFDVPHNILNHKKASQELGWSPQVSLDEGLKQTLQWLDTSMTADIF